MTSTVCYRVFCSPRATEEIAHVCPREHLHSRTSARRLNGQPKRCVRIKLDNPNLREAAARHEHLLLTNFDGWRTAFCLVSAPE